MLDTIKSVLSQIAQIEHDLEELRYRLKAWEAEIGEADNEIARLTEEVEAAHKLLALTGWRPDMSVSAQIEWERQHE